jgi:hypothetical protein
MGSLSASWSAQSWCLVRRPHLLAFLGLLVRRALAVVMLASGAKLLGASTAALLALTLIALVGGGATWSWIRARHGEAPLAWQQCHRRRPSAANKCRRQDFREQATEPAQ